MLMFPHLEAVGVPFLGMASPGQGREQASSTETQVGEGPQARTLEV